MYMMFAIENRLSCCCSMPLAYHHGWIPPWGYMSLLAVLLSGEVNHQKLRSMQADSRLSIYYRTRKTYLQKSRSE